MDGTWTDSAPGGTPHQVYEYRDGDLVRAIDLFSDGQIVRDYATGLQAIGAYLETRFDMAGNKIEQIEFSNSFRHGEASGWYPTGRIRYQGSWKDAREHGHWTWWHSNGDRYAQATFDEGNLIIDGDHQGKPKTLRGLLSYRALNRQSLGAFHSPLDIHFEATPLVDVLAFFQDLFEIPVRVDEESLKSADTSSDDLLITCDMRDAAPLSALQQILHSVGLTFLVDQQGLLVTDERLSRNVRNMLRPEAIPSEGLAQTLDEPVDVSWSDTPLSEVLAQFEETHGLDIRVDERVIGNPPTTLNTRVTASISGVSLHAALTVMLNELGFSWRVEDDVVFIAPPERKTRG
ncbi:MAG: toxin-antitoxin system YwqK family antitoxin [Planctomycetota bacterium]|jgi:hypothetical protein